MWMTSAIAPPTNVMTDLPPRRPAKAGNAWPTIAAASTHAGEETALIEAHRRLRNTFPRLLTIIAPRHPDRGEAVFLTRFGRIAMRSTRSSLGRSHRFERPPRENRNRISIEAWTTGD